MTPASGWALRGRVLKLDVINPSSAHRARTPRLPWFQWKDFWVRYFSGRCAILRHRGSYLLMAFPFPRFPLRKKTAKLTRQEERVFAEARELAQLRL